MNEVAIKARLLRLETTLAVGIGLACLLGIHVAAQGKGQTIVSPPQTAGSVRATPWGDPDLQGIWTNTTTTPFERPADAPDKAIVTGEEREAFAQQVAKRLDRDRPPERAGTVVPYNNFWFERGTLTDRTALIVDPSDGKLPRFTPAAQKRWDAREAARKNHPADSWSDLGVYDRCITRGMPGSMLPGFYNHNYHILQTPGYVVIVLEMIHDTRIIPLDRRPHVSNAIVQWLGDSRGRWEGQTLVVETTNLNDKVFDKGAVTGFGANTRLIERFTRVAVDQIEYRFTVDDPTTFTSSWTVSAPMVKIAGPLYEYACHEGNYAMHGILSGARAQERAAAVTPR
jgi:hypothetical protein